MTAYVYVLRVEELSKRWLISEKEDLVYARMEISSLQLVITYIHLVSDSASESQLDALCMGHIE